MESKFIKCQCHAHALELQYDADDNTVCVGLWNYGNMGNGRNLWQRLKIGFRYIFKNELYGDHVILGREEAIELNEYMQEKIK